MKPQQKRVWKENQNETSTVTRKRREREVKIRKSTVVYEKHTRRLD